MVISNKRSMYSIIKLNIKILPNFHEIITYLCKKITHFKKYVTGKVHILSISSEFCRNNIISISTNKIIVIIKQRIEKYQPLGNLIFRRFAANFANF